MITTTRAAKNTQNRPLCTVSTCIGNYVGSKLVFINGGWLQPRHVASFFTKSYGKKLIAQTGIGAIISYLITLAEKHFKGRKKA
ncbi:MAG: hypothetical protein IJ518_03800 [Clostridia bacterium]|nr:hypothetical protein [Clostridia bacterium]